MRKVKIDVAHGSYIIDSWDNVLSLRVTVTKGNEIWMWKELFRKQGLLRLDGFIFLRDIECENGNMISVTRQWGRADAVTFIPQED